MIVDFTLGSGKNMLLIEKTETTAKSDNNLVLRAFATAKSLENLKKEGKAND